VARSTSPETIKRIRLGNLKTLLRDRYGPVLPDDDAGRSDLEELLYLTAHQNMANVIEVWAPWFTAIEAERLMAHVKSLPFDMRRSSPKALGQRLRVTNEERERLGVWQIGPCDMSKDDLAEQRKAKARLRMKARRRSQGKVSRAAYLAQFRDRQKPWIAQGISRRTWFRRKAKAAGDTGSVRASEKMALGSC
jgi:hypothetical protein